MRGHGHRCLMRGVGHTCSSLVLVAVLGLLRPAALSAQDVQRIQVTDGGGTPVPHAVVSVAAGRFAIADDSGRITLRGKRLDSLRVEVRRIGYVAFRGWVKRSGEADYLVQLPGPVLLSAVTVTEQASTPLSRTGFYDRAERVRKGAIVGEFITPEELDARNSSQLSRLLHGRGSVRVNTITDRMRTYAVILGRGGCPMTIVVDGQELKGTAQQNVTEQVPTSVRPEGTKQERLDPGAPSVDQLVDLRSVMAIEIYPSTANAPAELQTLGGRGSCGIIAIWTGPRQ